MSEKYNRTKVKEFRYGILGLFAEKLVELHRGEIPICFSDYGVILNQALEFFTDEERPKIQEVLNAGLLQERYLRGLGVVNDLADSEASRKEIIKNFLTESKK
jgi:hypothetical protein